MENKTKLLGGLLALAGIATFAYARQSQASVTADSQPTNDWSLPSFDWLNPTNNETYSNVIYDAEPAVQSETPSFLSEVFSFDAPTVTPDVLSYTGEYQMDEGANVNAFLKMIRHVEASDRYDIIAGGDTFTEFSEHPFVINPYRRKPSGTTAAGGYQMVVGTWKMARDALHLTDFTPASQDAGAVWILQRKRPASYPLVAAGRFNDALYALRTEWDAFNKMLAGKYSITTAQAANYFQQNGGVIV